MYGNRLEASWGLPDSQLSGWWIVTVEREREREKSRQRTVEDTGKGLNKTFIKLKKINPSYTNLMDNLFLDLNLVNRISGLI